MGNCLDNKTIEKANTFQTSKAKQDIDITIEGATPIVNVETTKKEFKEEFKEEEKKEVNEVIYLYPSYGECNMNNNRRTWRETKKEEISRSRKASTKMSRFMSRFKKLRRKKPKKRSSLLPAVSKRRSCSTTSAMLNCKSYNYQFFSNDKWLCTASKSWNRCFTVRWKRKNLFLSKVTMRAPISY